MTFEKTAILESHYFEVVTMRVLRALTAGALREPEGAYNNQGAKRPDARRVPSAGRCLK